MTPNLIELIVQAVMAEIIMNKKQWQIEPMSGNFYSRNDIVDAVRTALASIPEMPQVDLEEARKYMSHLRECGLISEPYFGWCDVKGCKNPSAGNGSYYKDTGYWKLCTEHSNYARSGNPQPEMEPKPFTDTCTCGLDKLLTDLEHFKKQKG